MPIGGHRPGIDRGFRLLMCAPCRAGDHPSCKPFTQDRRLVYCECPGWDRVGAFPTVLPCLEEAP